MRKAALFLLFCLFLGVIWSFLFPEQGSVAHVELSMELPSFHSWLGRDTLGRDLFVRVLQGAQISLGLGLSSSLFALLMGISFGALAALGPKWVDMIFMRIVEVLMALPALVLMAVIAVVLQTQIFDHPYLVIFWTLALGSWMPVARLTRNLIHKEKHQMYVEAARVTGASSQRIFWRHITPNLIPPLLIFWSLQVPHAILAEGLLSFLGFGVKSPGVSWGALLHEGWKTMSSYPHLLLGPSLILFLTILSLNIWLENFRQNFEPKLKWEKFS